MRLSSHSVSIAIHHYGLTEVVETVALPIRVFPAMRPVATIITPAMTVIDVTAPMSFAMPPWSGAPIPGRNIRKERIDTAGRNSTH